MADYTLYVIVRNDISSMNSGKSEAHSGHAASKFVLDSMKNSVNKSEMYEWAEEGGGFGTQINLDGSLEDILSIENYLEDVEYESFVKELQTGKVVDPTYPYYDKVACEMATRKELTAFYIFGRSDNEYLKKCIGHLALKP